jgi:hypothetical protein
LPSADNKKSEIELTSWRKRDLWDDARIEWQSTQLGAGKVKMVFWAMESNPRKTARNWISPRVSEGMPNFSYGDMPLADTYPQWASHHLSY